MMHRTVAAAVWAWLLCFGAAACAGEYRIDSQADFDRLKAHAFQPGDRIRFERGQRFTGTFAPTGRGTPARPIRIEARGAGPRPRIDARGEHLAGLFLRNPSFWEVSGLEITNTDGTDEDQGDLFGIYVLADGDEGTYEHVHIADCHVHHVNGKVAGKRRGGIHVHIKRLKRSKFHDLRITGNHVEYVGGVGIGNDSSCGSVEFDGDRTIAHNLWTGVYVADNFVDHTGRNNVIARVSRDAVYERNTLANSSRYNSTGHSIFGFNCVGLRIQYNEAYGNVGGGGIDRGGFDADYNCADTYIQYNYSHDNNWFCGIMKRPQRNVVIRYNLSVNDRQGIYFFGFEDAKDAEHIHVYNNTHYVAEGLDVEVFAEERTPLNSRFENNIFYFAGRGGWGPHATGINTTFSNNVYHNIAPHPADADPRTGDPGFVNPGAAPTRIDLKTMSALGGYRLRDDSPFRTGANPIDDDGGQNLLKQQRGPKRHGYGAF